MLNPADKERERKATKNARREQKEFLAALERAESFIGLAIYAQYSKGRQQDIRDAIDALRAASYLEKTSSNKHRWHFKQEKRKP